MAQLIALRIENYTKEEVVRYCGLFYVEFYLKLSEILTACRCWRLLKNDPKLPYKNTTAIKTIYEYIAIPLYESGNFIFALRDLK